MTLLHVPGSQALEVYNTFQWDADDDNKKVDKIMEKFGILLFSRNQLEGESIDAYVTIYETRHQGVSLRSLRMDQFVIDLFVVKIMIQ